MAIKKVHQRASAKVAAARRQQGRQGRQTTAATTVPSPAGGPVRRARAARRPTRSSWSWPSSATSGTRATRTRTPTRTLPGPATLRRAAAQRDPGAGPDEGQLDGLAAGLQPRSTIQDLYFGTSGEDSLKTYYEKQSSGRYSVDGKVTDWVKVQYNEARYGRSNGFPCAGNVCANTWDLIRDAINRGSPTRRPPGRTDAQIKADLKSFDQWDRYDFDDDGNFNEPDGYIDHFQIVHAGGDQADGDPHQGEDAIWSHRWKAFQNTGQRPGGQQGRRHARSATPACGSRDYTIQPENGGVSRLRARVRPRPRPAGPLRHRRRPGQRRQLVDDDGPEPRVRRRATRASAPAPPTSAPGTSCSSAGSTTRSSPPARTARSTSARTSTTAAKAQGVVVVAAEEDGHHRRSARRPAGTKQWWSGTGDDLDATLTRAGRRCPAGHARR